MPENLTQSITKTMNQYLPVRLTQYAPDMAALNYRIQASIPTYKTVSKYIPTYIADVINAYTSVPADPDEALPYTWHPIDETSRNVCTVGPNSALFNCSREKLFEHMPTPEFAKAGLNLDVVWLTPIEACLWSYQDYTVASSPTCLIECGLLYPMSDPLSPICGTVYCYDKRSHAHSGDCKGCSVLAQPLSSVDTYMIDA
ncbi:hypothetical protein SARC_02025 [Sphaeroforma arctica JP610]|uniref:Uncharacterized protein n=1 Tax=Sphaeroforma arctica JP610 TaxID=667725 RepID=A0A0L0G9X0_9EUKA|nr:hypothetical protein SARC_02025 [Sphaeroforma arctica JP610]KNC85800.1 hypothetical protein SARC_02025 [Sphaeroforma arctica JP610]|eukprot:XP_014159702.1 hypothetical protein SARC_02025 [Sphaeroforma arctica JP610]